MSFLQQAEQSPDTERMFDTDTKRWDTYPTSTSCSPTARRRTWMATGSTVR